MLKLTGIMMILVSDFFIVKYILEGRQREISFIKDLIIFLKALSIEIIDLKRPLYEAITANKGVISHEIDELVDKFEKNEDSPREAIISTINNINLIDENTKKPILEYLNIAGRTTKEGMEGFLSVTLNTLNYILEDKIEKNRNSKKTVNATVYSLSILFVIFIM